MVRETLRMRLQARALGLNFGHRHLEKLLTFIVERPKLFDLLRCNAGVGVTEPLALDCSRVLDSRPIFQELTVPRPSSPCILPREPQRGWLNGIIAAGSRR